MLKDCEFRNSYSSGYEEPREFFIEALMESKYFDLGLGFFSSSGIRSLAYGFALFIANGGKMRVLINHILSEKDKMAIVNGQLNDIIDFEKKILLDIQQLTNTLSNADEQFFRCLSFLISNKRIEFAATVSTKGGIGHDKYGVFTDEDGNKVAFIGSANFSQTALELNSETITVFSEEDGKRISEYQELFDRTWETDTPHLTHIPMDSVITQLSDKFPTIALTELIANGVDIREFDSGENHIHTNPKSFSKRVLEKMELKEKEPRFPFPDERSIQKEAYKAWLDNNRKGIFAMATGSGKTVTALNCILKQYKEHGFYKVIIAVPTQALAVQWEREATSFNYQNIVSTHTNKDWKSILSRYTTKCLIESNRNIVIITTYATFNRKDIQYFVKNTRGIESFVYIADEAHNVGSPTTLRNLPNMISSRIGLSATPERVYDDVGSGVMFDFFNSRPPKYTYRYTMRQAIFGDSGDGKDGVLCHYDYYPIFLELTEKEMSSYESISTKLRKFIDPETGKYKKEAEMLLLARKRIIHKAENKKPAINNLLQELKKHKKLDYTFVFVPEGFEPDYSTEDTYQIEQEDIHIIDEYAQMFKQNGDSYHKYISGLDDAQEVLDNFANGDIQILLAMKCLDEGVDIPRAEHAIFCSSTGNPRQFVQRRGRVLRKCKDKEKAIIWDLIVTPPDIFNQSSSFDKSMFIGEVKRIVNFATLADNQIPILYGPLKEICEQLCIDLFAMLEEEEQQYN